MSKKINIGITGINHLKGNRGVGALAVSTITDMDNQLGKQTIQLSPENIEHGLKDSVVLVTGAAGLIGSEIVRQLIVFHARKIILLDEAEAQLYKLKTEILAYETTTEFSFVLGNVTNQMKVRKLFLDHAPSIVFHAAAYQNISLIEKFPFEAIHVNVGGTQLLADLSVEFKVERFIFISSDKAMNPTSIMGAGKRVSEIYIQSLWQAGQCSTRFISIRFGNVPDPGNPVMQLINKQIEQGGPVTIPYKDITYYFITLPEVCQLILEAGFIGSGGETFVLNMGESIKIYDLVEKMIASSGHKSGQVIKIICTGTESEKKLYMEPPGNKEKMGTTSHDKIMLEAPWRHDYSNINRQVTQLLEALDDYDHNQLIEKLMYIVPEYISMKNSYGNIQSL